MTSNLYVKVCNIANIFILLSWAGLSKELCLLPSLGLLCGFLCLSILGGTLGPFGPEFDPPFLAGELFLRWGEWLGWGGSGRSSADSLLTGPGPLFPPFWLWKPYLESIGGGCCWELDGCCPGFFPPLPFVVLASFFS